MLLTERRWTVLEIKVWMAKIFASKIWLAFLLSSGGLNCSRIG